MAYDELKKLHELKQKGILSEEEFQREKARVLERSRVDANVTSTPHGGRYWGMDRNTFCMLLHLSQLAGFVVPFAGLAMPIVMWATQKDVDPIVDRHGRVVLNWIVSSLIYALVGVALLFVIIGIPVLLALVVCDLVFVILGAVRANNGVLWTYPLSIPFFRLPEDAPRD